MKRIKNGLSEPSIHPYPKSRLFQRQESNVASPARTYSAEPSLEQTLPFADPDLPITVGPYGWLLLPAVIGGAGTFLLALTVCSPQDFSEGPSQNLSFKKKEIILLLYSVFTTLGFGVFMYYTIKYFRNDLLKSFFPISIGLTILLIYYGTVYLYFYRLNPNSFNEYLGDDVITQFINALFISFATFSTGSISNLSAETLATRTLGIIELMANVYLFILGLSIILSAF